MKGARISQEPTYVGIDVSKEWMDVAGTDQQKKLERLLRLGRRR